MLPVGSVFHTIGPVCRDENPREGELLDPCYRICLQMAEQQGVKRISFPAISTGAYGYPAKEAASIAMETVAEHLCW